MSHCFGTHPNLSAKDYTNKKANLSVFCNLRNTFLANNKKSIGTKSACLNDNGNITHFENQSSQLKIKKGFEYFSQKFKTDLSTNSIGQIMKNKYCNPYDLTEDNSDISNNFTVGAPIHTRAQGTSLGQTVPVDMSGTFINRYAEVNRVTPIELTGGDDGFGTTDKKFGNSKKIIYDYCAVKHSSQINVLKPGD